MTSSFLPPAGPRRGLAAALILAAACAPVAPFIWVDDWVDDSKAPDVYRLRIGDQIAVLVWNQPQLSGNFTVRDDGRFTQPLVGDIMALGMTTETAADQVQKRLEGLVINPKVTVSLVTGRPRTVTVLGEVRNPGRYDIAESELLVDVLGRAGGPNEFAARDRMYVLRTTQEPIRIRFHYDDLLAGRGKGASFLLHPGDVVIVE